MNSQEAKKIAKNMLLSSIAVAYYKLENEDYTAEEEELIIKYINQYGEAMAKRIGENYYTM